MSLVTLTTNLRSLGYGRDRPDAGSSSQPYVKEELNQNFNVLSNAQGPYLVGDDFILRGGLDVIPSIEKDLSRLTQFFIDPLNPTGFSFIAKQNILSRIGVKTQASGILNEGVYNPLSTLIQSGINAFGGHITKQGILPPILSQRSYLNELNNRTSEGYRILGGEDGEGNRLVQLTQVKIDNSLPWKGQFQRQNQIAKNETNVLAYGGGPNSLLGLGRTRVDFDTDPLGSPIRTGRNNPGLTTNLVPGMIPDFFTFRTGDFRGYNYTIAGYYGIGGVSNYLSDKSLGEGSLINKNSKDNGNGTFEVDKGVEILWNPTAYKDGLPLENLDLGVRGSIIPRDDIYTYQVGRPDIADQDDKLEIMKSEANYLVGKFQKDGGAGMFYKSINKNYNPIPDAPLRIGSDGGTEWNLPENSQKGTGDNPLASGIPGYYSEPRNIKLPPSTIQATKSGMLSGNYFPLQAKLEKNSLGQDSLLSFFTAGFDQFRTEYFGSTDATTSFVQSEFISKVVENQNRGGVYNLGSLENDTINIGAFKYLLTQNQIVDSAAASEIPGTVLPNFSNYKEAVIKEEFTTITSISPDYSDPNVTIDGNIDSRINYANPSAKGNKIRYSKGKIGQDGKVMITDRINALPLYKSSGPAGTQEGQMGGVKNDFVKFRIAAIDPENPSEKIYMHFRAFLDQFSDQYTGNWNTTQYMGRGEEFYKYDKFQRDINLAFTVAAQSKPELMVMYRKLNYLASNLAPDYTTFGYMAGPLVQLTVGGWCYELPGFIRSMTIDVPQESTWEIAINDEGTFDRSVKEMPHMVKVSSLTFQPIHSFRPSKMKIETKDSKSSPSPMPKPKQSLIDNNKYGNERYIALATGKGKYNNNYDKKNYLWRDNYNANPRKKEE